MSIVGFGAGPIPSARSAITPGRIQGSGSPGIGYPSPFFDVAHTYMPVTVKQLFRWCRYYFLTNPLINAAAFKLSEYPITDVIVEHPNEGTRKRWEEYLHDHLDIQTFRVEANLDYHVYGNGMGMPGFPFKKFLVCQRCRFQDEASKIRSHWTFTNFVFRLHCPKCQHIGDAEPKDLYLKNPNGIRLLRWNPEDLEITYNDITGEYTHYYTIPAPIRSDVVMGRKEIVEALPQVFLQALREQKGVIFNKEIFFHMRRPTVANQDRGWGTPLLLPVLKDTYYLQLMKKAQESILLEHIVPLRAIFPQAGTGSSDPYSTINLVGWREQIAREIARWRYDNNYIPILPLPIGTQTIGGDGRALLLTAEMQAHGEQILNGMTVPIEFVKGGMCLAPGSLVFTDRGLERLDEITVGECRRVVSHEGVRAVSELHRPGRKKLWRVRTRSGLVLDGAGSHCLLTLRDDLSQKFLPIEGLGGGEYVAVKVGANLWPSDCPTLSATSTKQGGRYSRSDLPDIRLPDRVTPELARLLGYLVSEGACTDDREMSFSNTDPVLFEDFLACVKEVFGISLRASERTYETTKTATGTRTIYVTQISRQTVVEFLQGLGLRADSYGKTVPLCIRRSPKHLVAAFLRAFFDGDGGPSVVDERLCVAAHSVSHVLLQEVQLLLLNMGIVSSLYEPSEGKTTCTLQVRSHFARDYFDQVGFTSPTKRDAIKRRFATRAPGNKSNTVPYVRAALLAAKDRHTHGRCSWRHEPVEMVLDKPEYTVDEIAALLHRERSSICLYIKNGLLSARYEPGAAGRFGRHVVAATDLQQFLQTRGLGRRRAFRVRQYEYGYDTLAKADLRNVKELEPELFKRIQALQNQAFFWDEVVSVEELELEEEMLDLGVEGAHSYQANGILSHNSYAGTNVSMRMLENQFLRLISQQRKLVQFMVNRIGAYLDWPIPTIRFKPFKMADDIQKRALDLQLNQVGVLSETSLLSSSDYNFEDEVRLSMEEASLRHAAMKKKMVGMAEIQGESSLVSAKWQAKAQQVMAQAAAAPAAPGEAGSGMAAPAQAAPAQGDPLQVPPDAAQFLQSMGSQLTGKDKMLEGGKQQLNVDLPSFAMAQAQQISTLPANMQPVALQNIEAQSPELAQLVKQYLAELQANKQQKSNGLVDTRPLPEQRSPRRAVSSV